MFWRIEGKVEAVLFSETEPTEEQIMLVLKEEIDEGGGFEPTDLYFLPIESAYDIPGEWDNCPAWQFNSEEDLECGPLIQSSCFRPCKLPL
jgi:hypothetical protein